MSRSGRGRRERRERSGARARSVRVRSCRRKVERVESSKPLLVRRERRQRAKLGGQAAEGDCRWPSQPSHPLNKLLPEMRKAAKKLHKWYTHTQNPSLPSSPAPCSREHPPLLQRVVPLANVQPLPATLRDGLLVLASAVLGGASQLGRCKACRRGDEFCVWSNLVNFRRGFEGAQGRSSAPLFSYKHAPLKLPSKILTGFRTNLGPTSESER